MKKIIMAVIDALAAAACAEIEGGGAPIEKKEKDETVSTCVNTLRS